MADGQEQLVPPGWEQAKPFFKRDGALRDIYCVGAGDLWANWLSALKTCEWPQEWWLGNAPSTNQPAFPNGSPEPNSERYWLSIQLPSGQALHTYFFDPDEIDVDLLPEAFADESHWQELVRFLKVLGDATSCEVRPCAEGGRDCPWLVYLPQYGSWRITGNAADHSIDLS